MSFHNSSNLYLRTFVMALYESALNVFKLPRQY